MPDPITSSSEETRAADFGMAWGVKSSFVSYIEKSPDGYISLEEGAAVTTEEAFYFPLKGIYGGENDLLIHFGGAVKFQAHFGLLSITLASPRLILRGAAAELGFRVGRDRWLHLAHIRSPSSFEDDQGRILIADHVNLTKAGVELFGDTYPEGEALEPLIVRTPIVTSISGNRRVL